MKARAVLFMLLIAFVSYTGFAHSHSDPGQNSEVKTYVLAGDYSVMETLTFNHSFELETTVVAGDYVVMDTGGFMGVKTFYSPPDTLCHKVIGKLHYAGTDTLYNEALLIDRYIYKQVELIRVRKLSEKHTAKPRDKIIKPKK